MHDYDLPKISEKLVHESRLIANSVCNGCLRLEVLTERRKMRYREKYYCIKQRGYFDPLHVDSCENAIRDTDTLYKPPKTR